MVQLNRKSLFLVGFLVFIIIVLVGQKFLLRTAAPKVVSVVPADRASNVSIASPILLFFDKPIEEKNLNVSLLPEEELDLSLSPEKINLTAKPRQPLKFSTSYTLRVVYLPSKKIILTSSFTTGGAQGSPEVIEENKKIQQEKYPLAPFSPPSGAHFYFVYTGPLKIKVYLGTNPEESKKEFFDWLKTKGIDPTSHQIEWIFQ